MRKRGPSSTTFAPQTLTCRVFGCRWRFSAEEAELHWWCARGCPSGGAKTYASTEQASMMANAMNREPRGPANILAILGGTLHREPRQRDPS